ncbi:hypothetical protein Cni_G03280 [Canna indica]|uniref:Uncharacterized protein n=1 Tax=Canna indica TaxID=4628 RepID=A0AAQ3JRM4_9LILI|nr:hypothetical protein Cni_G03280 [Canna indica]
MEVKRESEVDDSFRRPGSIPFLWEIKPGVPKHSDDDDGTIASAAAPPLQKLRPPPAMHAAVASSHSPAPLSPSAPSSHLPFSSSSFSYGSCFPSVSFKYRTEKRAVKIFSPLRRRSMSDHFVPPCSSSSPLGRSTPEEDDFEVSSSRSMTPSDAGSI